MFTPHIGIILILLVKSILGIIAIMGEITTIKVSKETARRLKCHGRMGDSFETVVTKMIEKIEDIECEPIEK